MDQKKTADQVREAAASVLGNVTNESNLPEVAPSVRARLNGDTAFSRMGIGRRDMLRKLIARSFTAEEVSDKDLGHFVELASRYELDPWAKEIWLLKIKGEFFVMVGRDGVRKLVRRQGMRMVGDAVFENDVFKVVARNGAHEVEHSYGQPSERGELVGAWALVLDGRGNEVGYHFSSVREAKPTKVGDNMPWDKSPSIMCRANAERQAGRQATPMGGLLVEGEEGLVEESGPHAVDGASAAPLGSFSWADLPGSREVIEELAAAIGEIESREPGTWPPAALQMKLLGRDEDQLLDVLRDVRGQLTRVRMRAAERAPAAEEPVDAEIVDGGAPAAPVKPGVWHVGEGRIVDGSGTQVGLLKRLARGRPETSAYTMENVRVAVDGVGVFESADVATQALRTFLLAPLHDQQATLDAELEKDMQPEARERVLAQQAALMERIAALGGAQ